MARKAPTLWPWPFTFGKNWICEVPDSDLFLYSSRNLSCDRDKAILDTMMYFGKCPFQKLTSARAQVDWVWMDGCYFCTYEESETLFRAKQHWIWFILGNILFRKLLAGAWVDWGGMGEWLWHIFLTRACDFPKMLSVLCRENDGLWLEITQQPIKQRSFSGKRFGMD